MISPRNRSDFHLWETEDSRQPIRFLSLAGEGAAAKTGKKNLQTKGWRDAEGNRRKGESEVDGWGRKQVDVIKRKGRSGSGRSADLLASLASSINFLNA